MHGATIKTVNAQQAKLNNNYKNTRLKCICWLIIKVILQNARCNNKENSVVSLQILEKKNSSKFLQSLHSSHIITYHIRD